MTTSTFEKANRAITARQTEPALDAIIQEDLA